MSNHHGMNRRKAMKLARKLGCQIRQAHGSGDVLVRHLALGGGFVRVSIHSKETKRVFTHLLVKAQRLLESPGQYGEGQH